MYRYFFLVWLLFGNLICKAQTEYRLSIKDSKMTISGTSSLHDWQCRVEQGTGQMKAQVENGNQLTINTLTMGMVVTSIRSIKPNGDYYEKGMDKNVYKALDAEKHPTILFNLVKINSSKPLGSTIQLEANGTLRIAGTTREVSLQVKATHTASGILFEGKVPLKMRDFNVEPPTALFGTIRTGNEVVVDFKMVYLPVK